MRIAQIAPLAEAVPPRLYGGTERVIWWLTEALVDLGHDVTLYASGDSQTSARLVPCADEALRLQGINNHLSYTVAMLRKVMDEADRCDELLFMRTGRVIARGSGAQLRAQAGTADLEAAFLAFAGDGEVAA